VVWESGRALVTGGASFIGSHLVDELLERTTQIRIVDDLSSGKLENIQDHIDAGSVEFHKADLLTPGVAEDLGFLVVSPPRFGRPLAGPSPPALASSRDPFPTS